MTERRRQRNTHVGGDFKEFLSRETKRRGPAFGAALHAEFDRLQLARQVKALREKRKMSQSELAQKAGTKQPNIARLESGRGLPRLEFLQRIANALGARLDVKLAPAHRGA